MNYSDDESWDDEYMGDPFDVEMEFDERDVQNSSTFQFNIQIINIDNPPVWRRLTVPSYFSFHHFHYILQVVFGWTNSHLYQFSEKGFDSDKVITAIYEDADEGDIQQVNAEEVLLSGIFKEENQIYTYIYDFGDSWEHQIVLEKIVQEVTLIPRLLDGQGACPPEDCGGVWGYENLKIILADKSHTEHLEFKHWLGLGENETWDSENFDAEETQFLLEEVFSR